ncbi:MAG: glycine cleavage system aminomethyltransferase GcvT [Flavobacteriaceae bacterium]
MKKTELNEIHHALGAKMVAFGGFEMPVSYSSIKEEHHCVREKLGVFDVSHMGEFFVEGPSAIDLLQHACSNDIAKLVPGKAQYNYFPNREGGIVDDLIVYQLEEEKYLLVVNASNIDKDWEWINSLNTSFNAQLTNASEDYSLLAVQGPKALEAMQALTDFNLADLPFYAHATTSFAGLDNIIVATTGYTGSGGVEIYCKNNDVAQLWKAIFKTGEAFGVQPIGLAARDTLRLEMGYCLYGNEINDSSSPIAAGLGWVTRPKTGFVNAESIGQQKENGTKNKLVGFELIDRGIPRTGHDIVSENGDIIGKVTSGTQSPSLNKAIGLGYVPVEKASEGSNIHLKVRNKVLAAKVVKLPFYTLQK